NELAAGCPRALMRHPERTRVAQVQVSGGRRSKAPAIRGTHLNPHKQSHLLRRSAPKTGAARRPAAARKGRLFLCDLRGLKAARHDSAALALPLCGFVRANRSSRALTRICL